MSLISTGLSIHTEAGTIALATALTQVVSPGDIVLLEGDLGAGKSFLARAFLRALAGDPQLEVPSPTFSLVQPYRFGDVECMHADLYRLSDESEAEELGLFDENTIRLIEWPDRLPELIDEAGFAIELLNVPSKETERTVVVKLSPESWKQLAALLESSSDISIR